MDNSIRTSRRSERHLLAPPLSATFHGAPVAVCDISSEGVRFRHDVPLQTGTKSLLLIAAEGQAAPIALETLIVWTQPDTQMPGWRVSGGRTYGDLATVQRLIEQLQITGRTSRIEELRSTERFTLTPALTAMFDGAEVSVDNLSTRGAGIEVTYPAPVGLTTTLSFLAADSGVALRVAATVRWTVLKSIGSGSKQTWRAGLQINEKPEMLRLIIGHLAEQNRATMDAHSLRLKLRVIQARARHLAPTVTAAETHGVPPEQFLLIQGVREELRLNANAALHWYRRARLTIADPATKQVAPLIAQHPDAIAVWEYLDRSIDPSIVGRVFDLG